VPSISPVANCSRTLAEPTIAEGFGDVWHILDHFLSVGQFKGDGKLMSTVFTSDSCSPQIASFQQ
jgi:hypothetical protein